MSKNKKPHITGKDIRRRYRLFPVGAVLAFLMGIYIVLVFTLNLTPPYERLKTDNVTVDNIKKYPAGKGSYDGLTTSEGVRYHLSGDYRLDELREKLDKGTVISIKWYSRNRLMMERLYIQEISLDGEILCAYTNDNTAAIVFTCVGSGVMFILGTAALIYYGRSVAGEIQRLPKKYRN